MINENFPDEVRCPEKNCERIIQNFEIEGILGKDAYDELNKKVLNKVFNDDKTLFQCPKCQNVMEVVQGKIYYDYKKDDGSSMSKMAAKHMSQHRIRCNGCGNNFCSSCKSEPYHLGKTCT